MLIKLNLEKAYDRLSWNFIHDTVEKVGLSPSWQWNIMHCIETVKLSVIWSGKNLEWFKPTRGIRQGDPISPYLFVLCMKRLGHVINQVVLKGRWKPIRLSRNGPPYLTYFSLMI